MSGETTITIIGNLTADPELRFTTSGVPVASFTVASTARTYNRETSTWEDGDTLFMRCSAWRDLSDHIIASLTRGVRVIVVGRLRQRSYETTEGDKRTVTELTVDEIGPSLRYVTASVTKATRGTATHRTVPAGSVPPARSTADPWAPSSARPAMHHASGTTFSDEPPF